MSSEADLPGPPERLSASEFCDSVKTDLPGVYILGSLNRHITVYSQQQRAINLVQALSEIGPGLNDKSIAIVGAGFAGLTAAAHALQSTDARVSLFDCAPRPLWIQDGCASRWLHPGIYDWPYPGSLEPRTNLPIFNWKAGTASDVVTQVREQWEQITSSKPKLNMHLETRVKSVAASGGSKLSVTFACRGHSDQQSDFDVVVLAVGFGLERGLRYWNDADGLGGLPSGSSVLISGFGDGGLADALRLSLPGMPQDSLVELVHDVKTETCAKLLAADKYQNLADLDNLYTSHCEDKVIARIRKEEPPGVHIFLCGRGPLYGTTSAILNRFLISQFRHAHPNALTILKGTPKTINEIESGKYEVMLTDGSQHEFDRVVLRWGPKPVYGRISPLNQWQSLTERKTRYRDLPQSLDRTRRPLKAPVDNTSGDSVSDSTTKRGERLDFIAYESSSRRWCVILHPEKDSFKDWRVRASTAMKDDRTNGRDFRRLNTAPLGLCAASAFHDQAAIQNAVRALCTADIVIVDLSTNDPRLFFLLGVRAVVRRGVTIICTMHNRNSEEFWRDIPFNLRELNPVSFFNEAAGQKGLNAALRSAFDELDANTYLDLPVYEYVRDTAEPGPAEDAAGVLLLRPFSKYVGARVTFVVNMISRVLDVDISSIKTVIDQNSPRLASQRLYQAIRRSPICVADITWSRPNVMFELGARLAVQPARTYCVIDRQAHEAPRFPDLDKFEEWLKVQSFSVDEDTYFKLSDPMPDDVYRLASTHFDWKQELYRKEVDSILEGLAHSEDTLDRVDHSRLYAGDNARYGQVLQQTSLAKQCGAWCYLADWEEPHKYLPVDLLYRDSRDIFNGFFRLGSLLTTKLLNLQSAAAVRLRQRIADAKSVARASGAQGMADLFAKWKDVQNANLWNPDLSSATQEEIRYLKTDLKAGLETMKELQRNLRTIKSPARLIILGGVRMDRKQIEIALRKADAHD